MLCQGIWDVQKDDNEEGCILRVYVTLAFSKRTIFKGIFPGMLSVCDWQLRLRALVNKIVLS